MFGFFPLLCLLGLFPVRPAGSFTAPKRRKHKRCLLCLFILLHPPQKYIQQTQSGGRYIGEYLDYGEQSNLSPLQSYYLDGRCSKNNKLNSCCAKIKVSFHSQAACILGHKFNTTHDYAPNILLHISL